MCKKAMSGDDMCHVITYEWSLRRRGDTRLNWTGTGTKRYLGLVRGAKYSKAVGGTGPG
jgi:hypothetical protein